MDIVRLKNPVTERDHAAGPTTAPVTLLEYGNFECIHCGRFFPVIKQVRKLLADDLRFVFRHFPTVQTHPHSLRAATSAEAAGLQQKFWEMHDQLFTHQSALDDHHLLGYARHIGLDVERFARDMLDDTLLHQIEADFDRSLFDEHITGTPTIYINETRYTGATDLESLLVAIRAADVKGRIQWAKKNGGLGNLWDRLRHVNRE
ncbi:MAG: DsbA family protein [Pyrinomonadaceae bacterium]